MFIKAYCSPEKSVTRSKLTSGAVPKAKSCPCLQYHQPKCWFTLVRKRCLDSGCGDSALTSIFWSIQKKRKKIPSGPSLPAICSSTFWLASSLNSCETTSLYWVHFCWVKKERLDTEYMRRAKDIDTAPALNLIYHCVFLFSAVALNCTQLITVYPGKCWPPRREKRHTFHAKSVKEN